MATIAILQHDPAEPPGLILPTLRRQGHQVPLVRSGNEHLSGPLPGEYQGLVMMGGPFDIFDTDANPWVEAELAWVREALTRKVPVLGVCLGAQILAAAAGARVYAGEKGKEIGFENISLTDKGRADPLCRFFHTVPQIHSDGAETTVFQWHGNTFDLPGGAVLLASSERYRHQAFRLNDLAYGLQFHFEMNENHIKHWLGLWHKDVDSAGVKPFAVRAAMQQHLGLLNRRGEELVRAFGHLVDANAKNITPPEPVETEEPKDAAPVRDTRLHPLTPQEQEAQVEAAKHANSRASFVSNRPSKKKPRRPVQRLGLPPALPAPGASTEAAPGPEHVAAPATEEPAAVEPAAVAEAQAELQQHAEAALQEIGTEEVAAAAPAEEAGTEEAVEPQPRARRREADLSTFEL